MAGGRKGAGIFKGYADEPVPAQALAEDFRWVLVEIARLPEDRDEKGEKKLAPQDRAARLRRVCKVIESIISLGDGAVRELEKLLTQLDDPDLEIHPVGLSTMKTNAYLALTNGDPALVRSAIALLSKVTIEKALPAPEKKRSRADDITRNGKTIVRPALPAVGK